MSPPRQPWQNSPTTSVEGTVYAALPVTTRSGSDATWLLLCPPVQPFLAVGHYRHLAREDLINQRVLVVSVAPRYGSTRLLVSLTRLD